MILVFVLEVLQRLARLLEDVFPPIEELFAEIPRPDSIMYSERQAKAAMKFMKSWTMYLPPNFKSGAIKKGRPMSWEVYIPGALLDWTVWNFL